MDAYLFTYWTINNYLFTYLYLFYVIMYRDMDAYFQSKSKASESETVPSGDVAVVAVTETVPMTV